jgi:CHAT domain-containing protein
VLLSPEGDVARFPFAALPGAKPGTYLLEDLSLVIVPVPGLLGELLLPRKEAPGETRPPTLLLVGDVDYDAPLTAKPAEARPVKYFSRFMLRNTRLAHAKQEITAIKATFHKHFPKGRATELLDKEATEAAVSDACPKHQFLHIVTHGHFASDLRSQLLAPRGEGTALLRKPGLQFHPGLLSGLALTGSNHSFEAQGDDGILTGLEVAELDLTDVKLVVLSACQTGLGEPAGSEGVLSLQRAFQIAGARCTIATLWQVNDEATQELMVKFYVNLWEKKMTKLEALRQAQLTMLTQARAKGWASPYYWAPFTLSGDWR